MIRFDFYEHLLRDVFAVVFSTILLVTGQEHLCYDEESIDFKKLMCLMRPLEGLASAAQTEITQEENRLSILMSRKTT